MRNFPLAAGLASLAPVAVCLTCCPSPALAQPAPPDSPPPLTEEEFLAGAAADSLFARAVADLDAEAAARRRAAATLANPAVEAERESPGEATQSTVRLVWRPPLDGRRAAAIDAADAAVDAARARRALAELEVSLDLRAAFTRWAVAAERAERIDAERRRLDELARRAEERARRGEDSGLTARRFRFATVEMGAESAVAWAEAKLAEAAAVAAWPAAAGRRPVLAELPDPDTMALPDPAESPAVIAARAERRRAEHEARLAGRFLAFPELSAGWQWQDDAGAEADGPVLGLAWDLPLFDRGSAERGHALREADAGRAREELAARRQAAELHARADAYRTLHDAVPDGESLDRSARSAVAAASAAYEANESTMTDFLDTLRSILAGRLAALDLHAAALAAHRELERAAGRPLAR
jgi:outer membrane protein TolC